MMSRRRVFPSPSFWNASSALARKQSFGRGFLDAFDLKQVLYGAMTNSSARFFSVCMGMQALLLAMLNLLARFFPFLLLKRASSYWPNAYSAARFYLFNRFWNAISSFAINARAAAFALNMVWKGQGPYCNKSVCGPRPPFLVLEYKLTVGNDQSAARFSFSSSCTK